LSTARSLVGSTLFGVALTLGLHYYKGMIMGLAIQTVMAPLNLAENPLIRALFMSFGSSGSNSSNTNNNNGANNHTSSPTTERWFDEKTWEELSPNDEIVDEAGNPVTRPRISPGSTNNNNKSSSAASTSSSSGAPVAKQTLQELLLDTWDAGASANVDQLMKAIHAKNCNITTTEDHWTPMMILAGLGAPGTAPALQTLLSWGADPTLTDVEGWTALHWAAFHGNVEAAKVLCSHTKLLTATDKEGLTPIETARKEGNDDVAAIYEAALGERKKSK
jgi:hypothetical protein